MILNLISETGEIEAPFINFCSNHQYYMEVVSFGAHFTKTWMNSFVQIDCNAVETCYGLPNTIVMDGVCRGRSCHYFNSQRSILRFKLNTFNWRNTRFEIKFSDPSVTTEYFWLQLKIDRE